MVEKIQSCPETRNTEPDSNLRVRQATGEDITRMMEIFESAKGIMRSNGNMHQWTDGYPSMEVIRRDIEAGNSYVCEDSCGRITGTFAFIIGIEPTYLKIYDGEWIDDNRQYGVIHRIAGTPGCKGVAKACLDYCSARIDNIRVDTHRDNTIMQHIMRKNGFSYCGIIHLASGDERLAYQRIREKPSSISEL